MITRHCDVCSLPIHQKTPYSQLHVPMSVPNNDDERHFGPQSMYRQFDVCLGCTRGLVRLKPDELRALDEGERIAQEQFNK